MFLLRLALVLFCLGKRKAKPPTERHVERRRRREFARPTSRYY
jgi:hypothetical protein